MRITILRNTVLGLLFLGTLLGQAIPAQAVPKGTSTKKYCGCTCATNAGNGFLYWEKVGQCSLADGKACKWKNAAGRQGTGTLHSCIDCTRDEGGGFTCRNQSLAPLSGGGARVPLEQIVPRGIEGAQEMTPPETGSEEKGK